MAYEENKSEMNKLTGDLLTSFQTYQSDYYNDATGEYDPELMAKDYRNQDTLNQMYQREFGTTEEYDPTNPEHLKWATEAVGSSMTSVDEIAIQEANDYIATLKKTPWYTEADPVVQAQMDEAFDEYITIISSGGIVSYDGNSLTITSPDGESFTTSITETDSGNKVFYDETDGVYTITTDDGITYESYENEDGDAVIDVYEDVSTSVNNALNEAELEGRKETASVIYSVNDDGTISASYKGGGEKIFENINGEWKQINEGVKVTDFDSGIKTDTDDDTGVTVPEGVGVDDYFVVGDQLYLNLGGELKPKAVASNEVNWNGLDDLQKEQFLKTEDGINFAIKKIEQDIGTGLTVSNDSGDSKVSRVVFEDVSEGDYRVINGSLYRVDAIDAWDANLTSGQGDEHGQKMTLTKVSEGDDMPSSIITAHTADDVRFINLDGEVIVRGDVLNEESDAVVGNEWIVTEL